MWNFFFFSCVLRAERYTLHSHHTSPLKISLILILLKEIFLHHFLYWKHISWQIKNTESFCSSYIYSLHLTNMLQAFSCRSKENLCKGNPHKSAWSWSKAIAAPSAAQRRRKILTHTYKPPSTYTHRNFCLMACTACTQKVNPLPRISISVIIFDSPLCPYPAFSVPIILTISADFHTGVLFTSPMHKVPKCNLRFPQFKKLMLSFHTKPKPSEKINPSHLCGSTYKLRPATLQQKTLSQPALLKNESSVSMALDLFQNWKDGYLSSKGQVFLWYSLFQLHQSQSS